MLVEVRLGDHQRGVGTPLDGGRQELELGGGQLLGRVGDEEDAFGPAQAGQAQLTVDRLEPAHARSVEEAESGAQHPVGHPHLDGSQDAGAVVRPLRHETRQVFDPSDPGRLLELAGLLLVDDHRQLFAVPDQRRDSRHDVRVDGTGSRLQQGVDQRALAALELPHHRDRAGTLLHQGPHLGQPAHEVGALSATGQLSAGVDRSHQVRDRGRAGHHSGHGRDCRALRSWRRRLSDRRRLRGLLGLFAGVVGAAYRSRGGPLEEVMAVGAEDRPVLVGVVAAAAPDHRRPVIEPRHRAVVSSARGSHRAPQRCQASERCPGPGPVESRIGWTPRTSAARVGNATPQGPRSACSAGSTSAGTSRVADRRRHRPALPQPAPGQLPAAAPRHPLRRRLRHRTRFPARPAHRVRTAGSRTRPTGGSAAGAATHWWPHRSPRPARRSLRPRSDGVGGRGGATPTSAGPSGSIAAASRRSTAGVGCS